MGLYFFYFVILLLCSIKDVYSISSNNKVFNFLYLVLAFMLIFRYGQGTDYFGYEEIYSYIDFSNFFFYKDIGFSLIVALSNHVNLSYESFSILYSIPLAFFYYLFIKRNTTHNVFALLILYSVFYIPFISSALRQSMSVGIFGAFMLPMLRKNDVKLTYYLYGVICCLFHMSSLILFFFPLLRKLDVYKHTLFIVLICFAFSLTVGHLFDTFAQVYERASDAVQEDTDSTLLALLYRFAMIVPILFVANAKTSTKKYDYQCSILYFLVYLSTWSMSYLSGRLLIFLRIIYLPSWDYSFINNKIKKSTLLSIMLLILIVAFLKEVNTAMAQGGYVNCNLFSYPFISVFEQGKIDFYRKIF